MHPAFLLYFTTAALCLLLAHPVGDYLVQTPHQADHKGLRGERENEGRWNCAKHAFTYTLVQMIAVLGVFYLAGYDGSYGAVGVFIGLNGVTHYVIDRRWTLEVFARAVLRKGPWIDKDPGALPHLDQAVHLALFLPVAIGIAAVSI